MEDGSIGGFATQVLHFLARGGLLDAGLKAVGGDLFLRPGAAVLGRSIAYYRDVFGAEVTLRIDDPPNGRVGHAELQFGTAVVMVSDDGSMASAA